MNFSSHCKQKFNKKVFSILCVSFVPYINFIKSNTVLYKFFEILNNYNNLFDNYLIMQYSQFWFKWVSLFFIHIL